MAEHADTCRACSRARERVERASQSFPALRTQQPPELRWDRLRAQIHWSVSSARRATQPRSRTRMTGGIVLGAAAAATLAAVLGGALTTERPPADPGPERAATAASLAAPAPAPAPIALGALVVREVGDQVMIDGTVRRQIFDEVLGPGAVIATGASRVDVQFDDGSAFALGPASALKIARLDSERIELHLEGGTLDVAVRRRAPEQRFVVVAGARTIEVRGTQFRVEHDEHDTTRVACAHGKVAVRDAGGEIELGASRKLQLTAATRVDDAAIAPLADAEHAELLHAAPLTLPVWTDPAQLVATSAALEVATVANRDVRVDGVEVGQGPLRVRVMPGRHTVETTDGAGRFQRAGWVDVTARTPARLAVHAPATSSGGAATRRRQLGAALDRSRLAQCTRSLTKSGLSRTFVHVELGIAQSGAVEFLNVIDTDLPSRTADCVRDVIASVRFASGPAATLRYRVDL
jgi:hypothetical protein